jgi:hypothetical protein
MDELNLWFRKSFDESTIISENLHLWKMNHMDYDQHLEIEAIAISSDQAHFLTMKERAPDL